MNLKDILHSLKADYSPELFTSEAISVVEGILLEKNGKQYLKCQIRGKEMPDQRRSLSLGDNHIKGDISNES